MTKSRKKPVWLASTRPDPYLGTIVALIFSTALSGEAGASLPLSTHELPGVSPFGGSMVKDLDARSGKKEGDLRALERDVRPPTTRKLIHLAERATGTESPRWRLSLVRALAHHERRLEEHEDLRFDTVRAIVNLFTAAEGGDEDGSTPSGNPGAERHLVRGTAAMALARAGHPLALKKLLAVALSGDEADPVGTALALEAIRSIPAEVLRNQDLSRLFSPQAVASLLAVPGTEGFDLDTLTVNDLVKFAEKDLSKGDFRDRASPGTANSDMPGTNYAEAVRRLVSLPTLPRQLARVGAWQKAFDQDPVWTLRTWALLGARLDKPVVSWGQKKALELVNSRSEVERSAAAWSLAVVNPDATGPLLERKDPIITRAILRQASEGRVAKHVLAELERGSLSEDEEKLAWKLVLQAPSVWASLSTARLRSLEKDYSPAVLAALASRLRTSAQGLGPNALAVQSWLAHKSPEVRSSAALGLARSEVPAAQGMLYQAYREETDPRVRRAIVASIAQTRLGQSIAFTELLSLDPDATCRELIDSVPESTHVGLFLGTSARTVTKVHDREGRVLEVAPAPDGFAGIVRSTF